MFQTEIGKQFSSKLKSTEELLRQENRSEGCKNNKEDLKHRSVSRNKSNSKICKIEEMKNKEKGKKSIEPWRYHYNKRKREKIQTNLRNDPYLISV